MILILIFIVGVLVGAGIIYLANTPEKSETAATRKKELAKERILELFAKQAEVSNNDVERLLSVSDATATNYLSELEADGTIRQIGDSGRGVVYRINGSNTSP